LKTTKGNSLAKLLNLIVFLLISCYTSSLFGDPVNMVHSGCDHLDMAEVRRLTALELNQANDGAAGQITLICDKNHLRIIAHQARTQHRLERAIELNDTNLKERIIALTVSQIISRENIPRPETNMSPAPLSNSVVSSNLVMSKKEKKERKKVTEEGERDTIDYAAISLGAGVKPHGLFSLPTGYWLLRSGIWFPNRWGLIAILSFEAGRTQRRIGSVRALSGLFGLGGAWRILTSRYLHLELSGTASIGYTSLEGTPVQKAKGGELDGLAGEFAIGVGGIAEVKNVFFALDLLVGYTVDNPTGSVVGDDPVTLAGFWLGGSLRIGFLKR
jgi:hypothetical protein